MLAVAARLRLWLMADLRSKARLRVNDVDARFHASLWGKSKRRSGLKGWILGCQVSPSLDTVSPVGGDILDRRAPTLLPYGFGRGSSR